MYIRSLWYLAQIVQCTRTIPFLGGGVSPINDENKYIGMLCIKDGKVNFYRSLPTQQYILFPPLWA